MDFGKRTYYKPDGTGRDRYIAINNGGLGPVFKPAPAPQIRRFSAKRVVPEVRPSLGTKFTSYVSNGKGRDTYILSGNGGLAPQYRSAKEDCEAHVRNLRSYERQVTPNPAKMRPKSQYRTRSIGKEENLYIDMGQANLNKSYQDARYLTLQNSRNNSSLGFQPEQAKTQDYSEVQHKQLFNQGGHSQTRNVNIEQVLLQQTMQAIPRRADNVLQTAGSPLKSYQKNRDQRLQDKSYFFEAVSNYQKTLDSRLSQPKAEKARDKFKGHQRTLTMQNMHQKRNSLSFTTDPVNEISLYKKSKILNLLNHQNMLQQKQIQKQIQEQNQKGIVSLVQAQKRGEGFKTRPLSCLKQRRQQENKPVWK